MSIHIRTAPDRPLCAVCGSVQVSFIAPLHGRHISYRIHHPISDLTDSIEFGPQPLKIIRQCIRQMELLKNVWQTILPELVYNKTMGVIVNYFCEEFIKKVVACEDISSETSNGLVNICETIGERLPAVFTVIPLRPSRSVFINVSSKLTVNSVFLLSFRIL